LGAEIALSTTALELPSTVGWTAGGLEIAGVTAAGTGGDRVFVGVPALSLLAGCAGFRLDGFTVDGSTGREGVLGGAPVLPSGEG
jgi:hypothetical protein